jgi:hypothetical protein
MEGTSTREGRTEDIMHMSSAEIQGLRFWTPSLLYFQDKIHAVVIG